MTIKQNKIQPGQVFGVSAPTSAFQPAGIFLFTRRMKMGTITFNEVKIHATKSGKCITCGKRRRRARTFWQTLNPYNKKADGTVKIPSDIRKELYIEAQGWREKPIDCCGTSPEE